MRLSEQLKAARKAAAMSQEDVARMADMTLNNYARIERGESGTTIATLERIAEVLGLRLELRKK